MSYLNVGSGAVVSQLPTELRSQFIRRTYAHVAGAIFFMAAVVAVFLNMGLGPVMLRFLGAGTWNFLLFLGLFIGAGIVADKWARSDASRELQYAGLALYAVVEAIVLLPVLYLATQIAPSAIMDAAVMTAALVVGLTYVAFSTRKDFSFMGPFLSIGFFIAIGVVAAGAIFGFSLGLWFSLAVVVLAAGSVLYNTSNIIHVYQEHQYVAAALGLFASIALMFRVLLQIFMSFGDD